MGGYTVEMVQRCSKSDLNTCLQYIKLHKRGNEYHNGVRSHFKHQTLIHEIKFVASRIRAYLVNLKY